MSDEIISSRGLFIVAALKADRLMMNGLRLLGQMVHSDPRALGLYSKPVWDHRQTGHFVSLCTLPVGCRHEVMEGYKHLRVKRHED